MNTYSICELNEILFEKFDDICVNFKQITLKGEIVDCRFFKNNIGISFKIKDEFGMFNCKCWNYNNIDIYKIKSYENSTCIISGTIKSNYFNNHYDFILEINKDIIKDNDNSLIKSLKDQCISLGYFENKKNINWNLIKKIGLISKKNTQGYNDFMKQLKIDFEIILKEIVLEGINTEKTLINAINEFQDEDIDIILIIRGGGSTIDISNSYDKITIFDIIKKSKKPIITAIGHEADKDEKLLITSISDYDYATPSRLAIEINKEIIKNKIKVIDNKLIEIKEKYINYNNKIKKNEYILLKIYIEKLIKDKYGALIININDNDKFIIIEKETKYYKIKLELLNEIKFKDNEIEIKNKIETGLRNNDIKMIKKCLEDLKENNEIIDIIKKTIKKIEELDENEKIFNKMKGELIEKEIDDENYEELYKKYLYEKEKLEKVI